MMPSRFSFAQSSAMRKSRLEGKPSLLPKPRRPGSTDRLSSEARRPSTTGHRSSSAEPRATFGGRLSKEASATKMPINGRARSQQGDRYGQSSVTPLRSSQYSLRQTTTPRTPSKDPANHNWETALEKALAFVTIKDQRPVSNVAWQRSEIARAQEGLAARGAAGMALIRPLTIARFVDITGALMGAIIKDVKLNNDNYVTKLPHLSKRLLYPGAVSKSWLKTVNTLHAFPHALALISYLLDLVNHIEMPIPEEWLYLGKDERACLRRDYLNKCWIRFQVPGYQFEDLNEEYLQNLTALLGNDDEKFMKLQQDVKKCEEQLEDPAEAAAEARRGERREALCGAVRGARAERARARAAAAAGGARRAGLAELLRQADAEVERTTAESQQLKHEVETQPMTIAERKRLLDEVDYAKQVQESKRALAEQIAKMIQSKESELALWQKKTLDACVEYKQGLIHLSAQLPHLASLAIDEKELMGTECASWISQAVEALRECSSALSERCAELARSKTALARKRCVLLDETLAKLTEIKSSIKREQQSLESERERESSEAVATGALLRELALRAEELGRKEDEYRRAEKELEYWEGQDRAWRTKLASMREYIATQRVESQRLLEAARAKRVSLVLDQIKVLKEKLAIE